MVKTLILMRHGKAEAPADGQTDFERELTEAGRRSLEAQLPQMLKCLQLPDSIAVLSSPAQRAAQTARLLARALKAQGIKPKGGVVVCEALWSQDVRAFLEDVSKIPQDTVFAVGHNPFIEGLANSLAGASLPCSTGSLTCIRINFDNPVGADNETANRLLCFVQGPVSQYWKTLVQLEQTLAAGANTVEAKLDDFLGAPDDIETLHKFRVSIRTLRSLVAFVRPWQDARQNEQLQQDLKDVVALTSRQRELDVFTEQAQTSSAASSDLVEFCARAAADNRTKVRKSLEGKTASKQLAKALAETRNVKWKKQFKENGLTTSDVRSHFDALASELEDELASLSLSDVELTHDVRKHAKRVRYVAENFKGIIGNDAPTIAKSMTSHQDKLGAICDARVNIDMIDGFLAQDIPEEISWDLSLLKAQNETFLYSTLKEGSLRNGKEG